MARYRADVELPLRIDRSAGSIPGQIVEQIRAMVTHGRLLPGDRLPSTRALADRAGVSRGSVTTAYDQLSVEGYVVADRGNTRITPELPGVMRSSFTGNGAKTSRGGGRTDLETRRPRGGAAPTKDRHPTSIKCPFDLRPGTPDTSTLANTTWRAAWRAAAAEPSLGYAPQGSPALRDQLSEYLRLMRSVVRGPEDLMVTAGARDGLRVLLTTLYERKARTLIVAVEDPGYPSLHRVPRALGHRIVPVPLDEQGLNPAGFPAGGDRPDVVLVTPSHQYPMGATMPVARRLELIRWARENQAIIVEDDYDSELRYVGEPLPALAALDEPGPGAEQSVATLGSFAKVLTPGLGLGYLLMPHHLAEDLVSLKNDAGPPISGILQDAMTRFMAEGGLQRHTARMRRSYRRRRDLMASVFDVTEALGKAQVLPMDGGLHAVLQLSSSEAESRVVEEARRRGVAVSGLGTYWSGGRGRAGVVVGFGGLSEHRFERGLVLLREALENSV
ncbi:MocR-like pyridoxine biosynthesis transcription factor PdxR [Rothia uropygioeca]|uniref:MocR-like pyridoxine biosynthesis transcription factor PdxR n=1 Tax=Kocuria sp. 257 TaxID=2021970 RepID=UPI001012D95A|nr:PLP-dependent aminotransferase family protein [Kocuria sp. 257]